MLLTSQVVRFWVLGGASRLLRFETTNRRRRGGKVGIGRCGPDSQGSGGTGGNLGLVFAGFPAPAFSTALFFPRQLARCRESPHYMGPEPYRDSSFQMFMNHDRATGQRMPEACLTDLPR